MIRVFPRKTKWTPTDPLAFVGDPPMELPPEQTVCVSVTFTWDMKEAERLALSWKQHYQHVWVGGPAYNSPGGDFTPGEFLKHGVVITSRGCVRKCPWCYVPLREGEIIEIPITEGWIIQDNNILACSREHIEAVCEMLKRQPHPAEFKGGLDGRLLKPWHIDLFKQIRIKDLWFACDTEKELKTLERVADLTADFPQQKKRCFVMIGYNGETLQRAEARLERVYELGFDPFSQLYQTDLRKRYTSDWRDLNRKWARPAAYRKSTKAVEINPQLELSTAL